MGRLATLLLFGAAGPLACSQPAESRPATSCAPIDNAPSRATSTPSFRRDIQPIFAVSCALSTACHGTDRGAAPQNHPLLGPSPQIAADDAMLRAMMDELLRPSEKAPVLRRIAPGRPQDSFLLQKVDGTYACGHVDCPAGCGGRMPLVGDPLPPETIDQIRDWILQGAQNN